MPTLVIGNSHAKTIKHAPNTLAHNPLDVRETYFVRSGWKMETAGEDGGRVRLLAAPPEVEDDPGVFPEDFDTIVVSAGGWWAARNELLTTDVKSAHPLGYMTCVGWSPAQGAAAPARVSLVSSQMFGAVVEAWIRDMPIIKLLQQLAKTGDSRIYLQPWPAPNRALKQDPDWALNQWYGKDAPRVWFEFFSAQRAALQSIAGELAPRVVLLDYPLADILEDGFMDGSLCNPDPFHGNTEYGALVVDQIAAQMR